MDIPSPPRDAQMFPRFYVDRRKTMIGFVRVFTSGKLKDPEAVASEGWCKFFGHWQDCAKPEAYLRKCMLSAAQDALRQAAREPDACGLDALTGGEPMADALPSRPTTGLQEDPWDPDLKAALDRLDDGLREVVLLDTELNPGERSDAEIGDILGIHRTTVYRRKRQAYRQLAAWLPADYPQCRGAWHTPGGGARGETP